MSSAFDHKIPGSSSIGMWWLVGDLHSNPGGGRPLEKKDMDISEFSELVQILSWLQRK